MKLYARSYDVSISVEVAGVFSCCGMQQVHCFRVEGDDRKLSPDQIKYLYDFLYREVRNNSYNKVLVAGNATAEEGWSGGYGDANKGATLSLEGFLDHCGFSKQRAGINPNNGHPLYLYYQDCVVNFSERSYRKVPAPVSPVPPASSRQNPSSSDLDSLVSELINQVRG